MRSDSFTGNEEIVKTGGHMKADLHLHSTASDGVLTPQSLVRRAAERGFHVIALSDHDSTAGICEAQQTAKELDLTVIPAVELSCGAHREIHILGYGFDAANQALLEFCAARRAQREERTAQMIEKLCQMGMPVSLERVREMAKGVMGRPHVARALVEAGYVKSVSEAFDRFIASGKPAYVPKEDVRVSEAVRLIRQAGGVAVLAHPMELKMGEMAIEALVHEWKGQGLAGIEVWHPSAANNHAAFLLGLARREGMLVTGGSDFHGETVRKTDIGEGLDRWRTAQSDVNALFEAIAEGRNEP